MAVLARTGAAVLSFVSVLLATRLLTPAVYGQLALLLVTSSLVYAVVASWSQTPLYVVASEEWLSRQSVSQSSTARLLIISAVAVGSGVPLLGGVLLAAPDWRPAMVVTWASASIGYVMCEHVTGLLETLGRYWAAALVQMVRPFAYAAALLVLLGIVTTGSLDDALWALTASWLTALTVAGAFAVLLLPLWPLKTTKKTLRRLWGLSVPLILFSIGQFLFGAVDLLFVTAFGTLSDVGNYSLAYQCFSVGVVVASAASPVLVPRLVRARDKDPGALAGYVRSLGHTVLPRIGAFFGVAIPLAAPAVTLVFGESYRGAGPPLTVLMVGLLFLWAVMLVGPVLLIEGETRLIGSVSLAAVVVNIVLNAILLGVFDLGLTAPAMSTALALAGSWWAYRRHVQALVGGAIPVPFAWAAPGVLSAGCLGFLPALLASMVGLGAGAALLFYVRFRQPLLTER